MKWYPFAKRPPAASMTKSLIASALLSIAAFSSFSANAAAITVGVANAENSIPFGNTGSFTRYQQVFGASAFSSLTGPVSINSLSFFAHAQSCIPFYGCYPQEQSLAAGTYTVRLSTTSRGADGLFTTLNSNVGSDVVTFFLGSLSNTLTINGATSFLYDPSMGNLLLDISTSSQIANGTFFSASSSRSDQMSRLWSSNGTTAATATVAARTVGLVTQFGYNQPPTPVPEPGSLMLLGAGLIAAGATSIRRRRNIPKA
jgi:hypothetical protein